MLLFGLFVTIGIASPGFAVQSATDIQVPSGLFQLAGTQEYFEIEKYDSVRQDGVKFPTIWWAKVIGGKCLSIAAGDRGNYFCTQGDPNSCYPFEVQSPRDILFYGDPKSNWANLVFLKNNKLSDIPDCPQPVVAHCFFSCTDSSGNKSVASKQTDSLENPQQFFGSEIGACNQRPVAVEPNWDIQCTKDSGPGYSRSRATCGVYPPSQDALMKYLCGTPDLVGGGYDTFNQLCPPVDPHFGIHSFLCYFK